MHGVAGSRTCVHSADRTQTDGDAQSERIARERDSLRDKELQVHAEAVKHYMGELETVCRSGGEWR